MFLTRASRGQTLPIWSVGIAAALILGFAAMQYGEVLRWQVRAQNAADAAAAAALSGQTQTWNEQLSLVYAAGVEEWRIRALLYGMQAAAYNDPGCQPNCATAFANLRNEYMRAVKRYTQDVQLVNRTSQYTFTQAAGDAQALITQLQANCGHPNGGDCGFTYTVVNVEPRASAVNDVEQDGGAWVINNPGYPAVVKQDYTPAQIEIVVCARVAPIVPSFLGFQAPTFTAIGRAAATSAMVTQEWIQPGYLVNPKTGAAFQPIENYAGTGTSGSGPNGWNWFAVNFGGNPAKAFPKFDAYAENVNGPEFSAVTGWWNAIPIKPYSGALNMGTIPCKAS